MRDEANLSCALYASLVMVPQTTQQQYEKILLFLKGLLKNKILPRNPLRDRIQNQNYQNR